MHPQWLSRIFFAPPGLGDSENRECLPQSG